MTLLTFDLVVISKTRSRSSLLEEALRDMPACTLCSGSGKNGTFDCGLCQGSGNQPNQPKQSKSLEPSVEIHQGSVRTVVIGGCQTSRLLEQPELLREPTYHVWD